MNETIKQLLRSGKLLILRENDGFICGAIVTLDPDAIVTIQHVACQIDEMIECQKFAGQTVEQAIEAAAELEGLTY